MSSSEPTPTEAEEKPPEEAAPPEEQPPASEDPTSSAKINPKYPTKKCKYAGVTFRGTRDKYQARIYKGNKEYNLGLYDLAADAALTYDAAHRLVKKIGGDRDALDRYTAGTDPIHWLDSTPAQIDESNAGLDFEKINFLMPEKYHAEREEEVAEPRIVETYKRGNVPTLEEAKRIARKEALRVCRMVVGLRESKRKGSRKKDRKKKKKGKFSKHVLPPLASDPAVRAALTSPRNGGYYNAPGLARPTFNPALAGMGHPFGMQPIVPMGPMGMMNPGLGNRAALGMMGGLPTASGGVDDLPSKVNGTKEAGGDKEGAKEENSGAGEKGASSTTGSAASSLLTNAAQVGGVGGANAAGYFGAGAGMTPADLNDIHMRNALVNERMMMANQRMMLAQSMRPLAGNEAYGGLGGNGAMAGGYPGMGPMPPTALNALRSPGMYGRVMHGPQYGVNPYSLGHGTPSLMGAQPYPASAVPPYGGPSNVAFPGGGYNPATSSGGTSHLPGSSAARAEDKNRHIA